MSTESRVITPGSLARPNIRGNPARLGDGNTWILADTVPAWGPLWDELHAQAMLRQRYRPEHIMLGATALLVYNYHLTNEQAASLIVGGKFVAMKLAVEAAMFAPSRPAWSYSDWVLSSLAANGLKAEDIPDGLLHAVLTQLVMLRRAVPEHEFVRSTARAASRGKFHAIAKQQAARREAKAEAAAEAEASQSPEGNTP
jgi:hypothetical protein